MSGAYLRGVGLACALGVDAESCVDAMMRGQVRPERVTLDGLAEPTQVAYYRIPDGTALFDPKRFERHLPAVTEAAVRQAGLTAAEIRALPLFLGSSCFSVGLSEQEYGAALAAGSSATVPMPCVGYDYLAALVERSVGCRGGSFTYNTACTSSANAVLGALRALQLGRCRHALVVGAELANLTTLAGFFGLQLLAPELRPFDAKRSGIVLGEGVGAVLLSAEPGRDDRLCIRGGASNCDGYSVATANPDGESVTAVLRQALAAVRLRPEEVRGIRAHGTASPTGDTAEAAGVARAFEHLPPLTVLKPHIGHTLGACGVNELVLYSGALKRGQLPATPGFEVPDPDLKLQPLTRATPALPGVYLLNHFGFGGSNTVLALEKHAS
ncbi:MAG TPA: beta-ketoacyl synthase N-terminal-like domain-containing protein [Gammaproteobacteria bacterium]|nr:beta-ketoacyl synthase N-terminal-like domain-containing protein [Gammaproteobacteria bacterium]